MKKLYHTPEGVRDIFGVECDKKRYLEKQIEKLFRSYGYQSIETPTFEFLKVFREEIGTTPSRDLYRFFDRDGEFQRSVRRTGKRISQNAERQYDRGNAGCGFSAV